MTFCPCAWCCLQFCAMLPAIKFCKFVLCCQLPKLPLLPLCNKLPNTFANIFEQLFCLCLLTMLTLNCWQSPICPICLFFLKCKLPFCQFFAINQCHQFFCIFCQTCFETYGILPIVFANSNFSHCQLMCIVLQSNPNYFANALLQYV